MNQTTIAGYRLTGSEDLERCLTLELSDSGSGFMCRLGDRWYYLGAVSWVEPPCREDGYTLEVYASTISMRQWVVENINNKSRDKNKNSRARATIESSLADSGTAGISWLEQVCREDG